MENNLGLVKDKSFSDDEWPTGKSVVSLAGIRIHQKQGESHEQLNQPNLVVIPQERIHTDRPIIPATLMEKLSYYRAFTSSSSKIEMLCMQQNNVNRFTWFYISNALCKSLSMTYVYIFLSAYAPDHHLFVPKMVPIFYGLNWINVISARFLLQTMSYNTALHFYYAIAGVVLRAPWNRCFQRILELSDGVNFTCMELEEFAEQFLNKTIKYDELLYITPDKEYFSLAQMLYYDATFSQITTCKEQGYNCFFFVINLSIWIISAGLYNQLFKRYIWKILHYAQIALFVLLLLIFFHLVVSYEDKKINHIEAGESEAHRRVLMSGDYDMLAETMTSPPVAHVLSARTTSEIKPSLNSAVIVISNGVYYIFKALTSYLMKKHCERWVNASIIHWNFGSASIFYFWPIYFATFNYGAVIAVIFFALNAIVEYCMFIITFQCLIEVVKYEWTWLKPWCMSVIIVAFAIFELLYVMDDFSGNSYIFYTSLSSLAEILIIFWIYPRGRFLDDLTFHFGVSPTRFRRWTFCFLPWFYLWKVFVMLYLFYIYTTTPTSFIFKYLHTTRYAPTCIMIMFVVGAVCAFYEHVLKRKKGFCQLFKPVPEWGPKDFRLRQLRKKFDSREYIVSQAPRDLSRYLIEKSGLVSYKLDVLYDVKPRSTVRGDGKDAREKEH